MGSVGIPKVDHHGFLHVACLLLNTFCLIFLHDLLYVVKLEIRIFCEVGNKNSVIMPVSVELKYEYFNTWAGRVKLVELALALLCMMCAAPAYHSTQHWFLLVVTLAFLGTIFFSLYHLCLDTYLKTVNIGWLPTEFWFTAATSFFYLTAFAAQLADFSGVTDEVYQYWYDAQVAAGVFALFNNIAYCVGTYFLYLDWKSNPAGTNAPQPVV